VCNQIGGCAQARVLTIPMLREQIAAGARFEAQSPDRDGARCVCGDGVEPRDRNTDLCKLCWRAWRFGEQREFEPTTQ
jgi:hypothetical protein